MPGHIYGAYHTEFLLENKDGFQTVSYTHLDTEGGFTGWDDGTGAGAEETLEQALAEERLAELENCLLYTSKAQQDVKTCLRHRDIYFQNMSVHFLYSFPDILGNIYRTAIYQF